MRPIFAKTPSNIFLILPNPTYHLQSHLLYTRLAPRGSVAYPCALAVTCVIVRSTLGWRSLSRLVRLSLYIERYCWGTILLSAFSGSIPRM